MSDWTINFPNEETAQQALADAGFSLGSLQRSDPRGIMYGDFNVQKWRNLSKRDVDNLHGVYQRSQGPGSPVRITLKSGGAPGDAIRKLETASETVTQ